MINIIYLFGQLNVFVQLKSTLAENIGVCVWGGAVNNPHPLRLYDASLITLHLVVTINIGVTLYNNNFVIINTDEFPWLKEYTVY